MLCDVKQRQQCCALMFGKYGEKNHVPWIKARDQPLGCTGHPYV